jgi:hypothetical protein
MYTLLFVGHVRPVPVPVPFFKIFNFSIPRSLSIHLSGSFTTLQTTPTQTHSDRFVSHENEAVNKKQLELHYGRVSGAISSCNSTG